MFEEGICVMFRGVEVKGYFYKNCTNACLKEKRRDIEKQYFRFFPKNN
jgi:hypothetical protein